MKDELIFPKRPFRTAGGAHVPHRKNTAESESVVMPPPSTVVIPMQMHIGAPCAPIVAVGDYVKVGQKIGDSEAYVSAPIHASVSGTVKEIRKIILPNGAPCDAVVIESDGLMEPAECVPPTVTDAASLAKAARDCGLVGLGGAGFPAHVKLTIPEGKKVDTLLVNVAECEPYLTADYREVMENSWDVMSGIYSIKEYLGIHRVIIGVEENKPEAIRVLTEIADNETNDPNDEVRILKLHARYPQGAEKVLIRACTGRRVPPGKLPADVGCIVINVTSVATLSRYIKSGIPLTRKRLTVDGSAVPHPMNVIVPIGTRLGDILDFVGTEGKIGKVFLGGPMMGNTVGDLDTVVQKNNNGLIVMREEDVKPVEPTACIRCGKCLDACAMSLSPMLLERAVQRKDIEALTKLDLMSCMECGCCAYGCPAKRPLVQTFRLGKALLKEARSK